MNNTRVVSIPKDLNDIKEKVIMGFTKRQVICFGIGLVIGAPRLSDASEDVFRASADER